MIRNSQVDPAQYPALAAGVNHLPGLVSDVTISFTVNPPTTRKAQDAFALRPGVADEEAVELFAYGYCTLLAGALHDRSGWELAAIEHPDGPLAEEDEPDPWTRARWTHVGVITPDGRFLDIHGPRPVDEVNQAYGGWVVRRKTPADFAASGCASPWTNAVSDQLVQDVIRLFADQLVTAVEKELVEI